MLKTKGVFFDVDGVLLDSLKPHLQICENKNEEFNLGLKIPDAYEFKKIVIQGTPISPMEEFFKAVGFPEKYAKKADRDYQKHFQKNFHTPLFPGVGQMLEILKHHGIELGIVTANIFDNIREGLGQNMRIFNPSCIFAKDNLNGLSKSDAIVKGMTELKLKPENIVFVGDQPKDREAAIVSGVNFLGVSYGWGISENEIAFPVVNNVLEIADYILGGGINSSL